MSRVGKEPVNVPDSVEVQIDGSTVKTKGPKGELVQTFSQEMVINKKDKEIIVGRPSDSNLHKSLHGLTRSLIANMVSGVSEGFTKELEIIGVGYRASKKGDSIELRVGFSNPVKFSKPKGVEIEIPSPNRIIVKGADKQLVGEVAAEIRAVKKPEPYKGKGIRYVGEYVRRKVGKTVK